MTERIPLPRIETGRRVRRELVPLIGVWQAKKPDCLLPTTYIVARAPGVLGVTPTMIRICLTEAVSDGSLVEVLLRRDWLAVMPRGGRLPKLYAVPEGDRYRLVREAPASRGSNNISFLLPQREYQVFLELQRAAVSARG
jgi:hypothetical protein